MQQDFSIWEYETYHKNWDVAIIGAGITGLSTGISILEKNPDSKILIVDRWFIPLGASTRNAGFACFGSPSEILHDIKIMGEQKAFQLVKQRWQGLELLKKRLHFSKANYENLGGYELFHTDQFENVFPHINYLNDGITEYTGLKNTFTEVDVPENIRGFTKAIKNPYEGQLHPAFMIDHLKHLYLKLGGKLWTGFDVDEIEENDHHVYLKNKFAFSVQASKAIVTINAFAKKLLPQLDVQGARNHVMVTSELPHLSWKGCFHHDEGFYYFRNLGQRILLGGARNVDFNTENTDELGRNPVILDTLRKFLYDHLAQPDQISIDYLWSGIIAIGQEKSPIVKAVTPRIFVGVRCSGMGIALASLMGEMLSKMVVQ